MEAPDLATGPERRAGRARTPGVTQRSPLEYHSAGIFVFFALLDTGSFPLIVLATVVALALHAAMYGPQASFIAVMFPTRVRYSGASMGYQLAGILGGALAPIISVALLDRYDTSLVVSLYVVAMLAITAVCVLAAPETSRIDLHADPAATLQPDSRRRAM
jgi:hypothetical protein